MARLGSFTAAARELNMSTPTISRLVGELEDHLGVRLFNRTTRKVALTDAGEEFLGRSASIIDEIDMLMEQTRTRHSRPQGRLRISSVNAFGHDYLAPSIPEFLERYPQVRVDLEISNRQVNLVEEHFDLAIRLGSSGSLKDSSMVARRIFAQKMIFVATPGYCDRYGTPDSLDDLGNHKVITQISGVWGRIHRLRSPGGTAEYHAPEDFVVNSPMAVRNAVLTGYGCALVIDISVAGDIKAGRLVRLLPGHETVELPIFAVYPHRTFVPARVRLFVDYLVERFGRSDRNAAPA